MRGADTGDAQQARQRSESDRISAELGAKLLAGWTMLDAYCPRCPSATGDRQPVSSRLEYRGT